MNLSDRAKDFGRANFYFHEERLYLGAHRYFLSSLRVHRREKILARRFEEASVNVPIAEFFLSLLIAMEKKEKKKKEKETRKEQKRNKFWQGVRGVTIEVFRY